MKRPRMVDALALVLMAAIAVATGHLILTTALNLPDTLATAQMRTGM